MTATRLIGSAIVAFAAALPLSTAIAGTSHGHGHHPNFKKQKSGISINISSSKQIHIKNHRIPRFIVSTASYDCSRYLRRYHLTGNPYFLGKYDECRAW